jgi:hypothetical protein
MVTTCTTKGSTKEEDALSLGGGSCRIIPLSSYLLRASPPAPTIVVVWAVVWAMVWTMAVAVKDNNHCQNGGGHQHQRLTPTVTEWMRMVRVQK